LAKFNKNPLPVPPRGFVFLTGDELSMLPDTIQRRTMYEPGSRSSTPTRRILVIEDDPADANLMRMVHDDKIPWSCLDIVNSGSEAMQYLCGEGKYADAIIPDVILLDMFLPMTSDLELIGDLRALPGCELIPIVMVSGSESPAKLREAYRLGVNCVISKSSRLEEHFRKLTRCFEFWCGIAELPHRANEDTARS